MRAPCCACVLLLLRPRALSETRSPQIHTVELRPIAPGDSRRLDSNEGRLATTMLTRTVTGLRYRTSKDVCPRNPRCGQSELKYTYAAGNLCHDRDDAPELILAFPLTDGFNRQHCPSLGTASIPLTIRFNIGSAGKTAVSDVPASSSTSHQGLKCSPR
ncbi:hypothetical protein OF83DRAFT_912081 [Amylostereum chailletii]|nr:hypothetical protein OF83DRAFT_912081 [Amylostereum chailletii]